MDEIMTIETVWGSELHQELIALETKARVEWRESPEARVEMTRLKEAAEQEMAPLALAPVRQESLGLPVFVWE